MSTKSQKIVIGTNGRIRYLTHDVGSVLLDCGKSETRRASWIVPTRLSLRALFFALRFVFGDVGRVADFTRGWRCDWTVDLLLSDGPVVSGFSSRESAVDYEVKYVLGAMK